jgi:PRC-barrel domain
MNRLLACTAIGLFLGLSPALAEPQTPLDEVQTPPAVQEPAQSSQAMPSDPSEPSDPAAPIPGDSSEMSPQVSPMQPDQALPPPQSSEAPRSIAPAPSADASANGPQFLSKQESSDWLASNLIGQSVVNGQDEVIGDINDLVTDENGKVVAVLIGSGGFLGLGEKDVALRFEDLKFARDENNDIKVIANVSQETLASAPDYQTLAEQKVTVGSNKGDREDRAE